MNSIAFGKLASDTGDRRNTMAGWHFSGTEIWNAIQECRMLNVSIDLSNPCNLNCPYCYIESKNSTRKLRLTNEITIDETLRLVTAFAEQSVRTINLVGAGEPTIDPFFSRVITAIASSGIIPVVFTNGVQLAESDHLVDLLYESNATIALKYNAVEPWLQDLIAGKSGYTAKRDLALKRLIARGFSRDVPTRLAFDIISLRGNLVDQVKIHRFCRLNNIFPILGDYIPTGRTENGEFAGDAAIAGLPLDSRAEVQDLLQPLSASERMELYQSLRQIDEEEFRIVHKSGCAYYGGSGCTQLIGIYVDIKGDVWPCVARTQFMNGKPISKPLGNIRKGDSIQTIWQNDPFLQRLRSHYDGSCPYKPMLNASDTSVKG